MKHLGHVRTDLFTLIGLYQRRGNKEGFRKFGRYCEVVTLREAARANPAEKELQKVMAWLQEKGISYAAD